MSDIKVEKGSRAPRANTSRSSEERRKPWRPPSLLDAPEPPEGYLHRWIRAEMVGQEDRKNISSRLREGFELVRADEYPDFEAPSIDDGKHAGVIGVGGLLLARIPIETVQERNAYFAGQTESQMAAVDHDMLREQHPSMPISKPDRQSRVSFGGPKK